MVGFRIARTAQSLKALSVFGFLMPGGRCLRARTVPGLQASIAQAGPVAILGAICRTASPVLILGGVDGSERTAVGTVLQISVQQPQDDPVVAKARNPFRLWRMLSRLDSIWARSARLTSASTVGSSRHRSAVQLTALAMLAAAQYFPELPEFLDLALI